MADDFADTGPPGVAGPGAPANRPSEEDADKARLERDQAWVDENLTGLQEQLVRLYELEDISSEIRALRRDLEALDEKAKEEDRQAIESKIAELVKQEDDLVFAAYDADKEIGTDDGILLTDCFMTYKGETDWEPPVDDKIWAAIVAIITSIILLYGRFGLIQSFSTAMVACFTVITIVNLFLLNFNPSWAVSISDIMNGMSFRLPPRDVGCSGT